MHVKYLDSVKVTIESLEYAGGSIFFEFILQLILKNSIYSWIIHVNRAANPYDFGVRLTKLACKIRLTISRFILPISVFSIIVWNTGIFISVRVQFYCYNKYSHNLNSAYLYLVFAFRRPIFAIAFMSMFYSKQHASKPFGT